MINMSLNIIIIRIFGTIKAMKYIKMLMKWKIQLHLSKTN